MAYVGQWYDMRMYAENSVSGNWVPYCINGSLLSRFIDMELGRFIYADWPREVSPTGKCVSHWWHTYTSAIFLIVYPINIKRYI